MWCGRLIIKSRRKHHIACGGVVEHRGLEPLTPTLPVLCAPNCANAPYKFMIRQLYHSVKENASKNGLLSGRFCYLAL